MTCEGERRAWIIETCGVRMGLGILWESLRRKDCNTMITVKERIDEQASFILFFQVHALFATGQRGFVCSLTSTKQG